MRTLCLILVLVNALFFSWAQLIDVKGSPLDRVAASSAPRPPRIVLAREVATTPERPDDGALAGSKSSAEKSKVARAAGNAGGCTSVGPFSDLADASQAQAVLRTANFQPRQRLEQGELWVGYWVSVQDFASREAAETSMKMLKEKEITDVYLMPGSSPPHVLSLGVFSDYKRAQRRAEDVRKLGLNPRIDDRKRPGSVYWIDVDLPEAGMTIDTGMFQTGAGKIMRLELRACPKPQNQVSA